MITDTQQPQPGPSPTPTPKPVMALKIVSISAYSGGRGILEFPAPLDSLLVDKDYMDTCQPVAGGYYCKTADVKFFLSDTAYSDCFS